MASNPRHDAILRIVEARKSITVNELTERLRVSEVTIRKDLTVLEEMGLLMRTRGGAMLAENRVSSRSLKLRRDENREAKQRIAERALDLVQDGETVYLDSGSTCSAFASLLAPMSLRVVTNSIDVLVGLSHSDSVALHSLGGAFRREAGSLVGPLALEAFSKFRIDVAFLGTTGLSEQGVFTTQNLNEAQIKEAACKAAGRRVVLMDASKYPVEAFAVFARPGMIDVIVTDLGDSSTQALRELGFELLSV